MPSLESIQRQVDAHGAKHETFEQRLKALEERIEGVIHEPHVVDHAGTPEIPEASH